MLKGKKILIGITGGIAAYKIPFLIRLLIKEGAEVKIIMTKAARDFVTPLTLSTLSGHPVHTDFFNENDGQWHSHIEFGNWADIYLVAPATANTLGKMANGIADNLLIATYLAAKCTVLFAPAMDLDMYKHPTTSQNIKKLESFGNIIIEPTEGELASGLCGAGRMEEPDEIMKILSKYLQKKKDFSGKKVLISAGPTFESIDPVRFIGNFSSGKMGYAIAEEMALRGAEVKLVSGPTKIAIEHTNIELCKVTSASEMYEKCVSLFQEMDVAIMAAAVADYTPSYPDSTKMKKKSGNISIELKATRDILKELGGKKKVDQVLVGFALETNNEIENAKKKLRNKNLDFIVLNSLQDKGAGFDHETNKISIIDRNDNLFEFPLKQKTEVATDIVNHLKSY